MTVCIAAKCAEGIIFGISDRMVTAGDIQFEPPATKIFPLTTSIVAMTSDEDAALHAEILQDLTSDVADRVAKAPSTWLEVEFVTELYLKHRNEAKRRRAERDVLFPLGLDSQTFINKQNTTSASFIRQITSELVNYKLPGMSVIFCGADPKGQHIYVVHDNDIGCYDDIGFASIGIGARHANSQFMFQGHNPNSPLAETLLLAYIAKKRAEVAPGVGTETDIFFVGPALGSYSPTLHEELRKKLQVEYGKILNNEKQAHKRARSEMNIYVKKIQEDAAAAAAATAPTTEQSTDVSKRS